MTTTATPDAGKEIAKHEPKDEDALGLRGLLSKDSVKKRFEEVLGKEGAVFSASLLSLYNGSAFIQRCTPKSLLNAGFQAAALKLPITPGLGQAAIVPYQNNKKDAQGNWTKTWEAQFQIMVRGYIQLAHRSGQYKRINLAEVHEGELIEFNEFTGEVKLDAKARKSDKVVGYFFFFELINGYRHETYWTVERCIAHGKKYSKAFQGGKGPWVDMPAVMCEKTVVKNTLQKWGILSSEMRQAISNDQAVIKDDGTADYIDGEKVEDGADGDEQKPELEPQRASHAAKIEAPKPSGNLVDNVAAPTKKDKDWHVLIGGKSYAATEAMAKAAKGFMEKKVTIVFDATEAGTLTELQEAGPEVAE